MFTQLCGWNIRHEFGWAILCMFIIVVSCVPVRVEKLSLLIAVGLALMQCCWRRKDI